MLDQNSETAKFEVESCQPQSGSQRPEICGSRCLFSAISSLPDYISDESNYTRRSLDLRARINLFDCKHASRKGQEDGHRRRKGH